MNREYTLAQDKNNIVELARSNLDFVVEEPKKVIENMTVALGHNNDHSLGFIFITGPMKKDIYFEFNINDSKFSYDNHRLNQFEESGQSYFGLGYSESITNKEFYRQLSRFTKFLSTI